MRKLRRQPISQLNNWDMDREEGDYVFKPAPELEGAHIYVLRATGRNKAAAGELTPRVITKNGAPRLASLDEFDVWRWVN